MTTPSRDITTATILFTDVVDSTATRIKLGEEDADHLLAGHQRLLRAVARAHHSVLLASVGDGIMAVFRSATDALLATAAIEHAVAGEYERHAIGYEIRAGLSSGDVSWDGDDVHGLPVVEAARLAGQAERGRVLCSELTMRLAFGREGFEFKEVGWLDLKGIDHPLLTYEVMWWQQESAPPRIPGWLHSNEILPLVGRDSEFASLLLWLDEPVRGPSVRLVTGPPGAGKTRLVAELVTHAVASGHIALIGRCTDPALGPFQALAEAVACLVTSTPALLLQVETDPALARLVPELCDAPFRLVPPPESNPDTDYFRLVSALVALLDGVSALSPVLLVLDDLQWASDASMRLLTTMLRQLGRGPIRVIATVREAALDVRPEIARHLKGLLSLADVGRVTLRPLTADDVAAALAQDGTAALDPNQVASQVMALTGGNAFLVTETVRELRNGGTIAPHLLTDSMALFIAGRVDRAGASARDLIQIVASSEGVDIGVLRRAVGASESEFVVALEEAVETGVVVEQTPGVYGVAHDLAREAITSGLSRVRSVSVHRRIADALLYVHPNIGTTRPYLLARHLLEVATVGERTDVERAIQASVQAACLASSRLAHPEAVRWYQQSLRLLNGLDEVPDERVAELTLALGEAKWRSGDRETQATLVEAGRRAQALGRADLLIAAALAGNRGFFSVTAAVDPDVIALIEAALAVVGEDQPGAHAELLARLAAELTWAPDGDRRFALSDEALDRARHCDDSVLVNVLSLRHLTIGAADTLPQRLADCEELGRVAEATNDDLLSFQAAFHRTGPLLELGDTHSIAVLLDEAERLALALGQPHLRWLVAFSRTGLWLMVGDIVAAEAAAEDALRLGTSTGNKMEAVAFYSEQIAEIRRLQGRLDELLDGMRAIAAHVVVDPVHAVLRFLGESGAPQVEVERLFDAATKRHGLPPRRDVAQRAALDNLAYVAAKLDRPVEQQILYDALSPHAETYGHSAVAHPCGHHYLALLAAALGQPDKAFAHFGAAARLHERAGVPLLLAESLLDWAAVAGATGATPEEQLALCGRVRRALGDRPALLLHARAALIEDGHDAR